MLLKAGYERADFLSCDACNYRWPIETIEMHVKKIATPGSILAAAACKYHFVAVNKLI
jgi:hypothetical protein